MLLTPCKGVLRWLGSSTPFQRCLRAVEAGTRGCGWLRVLTYHRIDEPTADSPYYPGLISATPSEFSRQMQLLADRYHVVDMHDVVAAFAGKVQLPSRAVLLTFDDATRDFAEHAWPILQRLELPATVFVPTDYPGNSQKHFWWDRLFRAVVFPEGVQHALTLDGDVRAVRLQEFRRLKEVYKTLPYAEAEGWLREITSRATCCDSLHNNVLDWKALNQLADEGVTLLPHTCSHPMLNRMSTEMALAEIENSWRILSLKLQRDIPRVLAYPAGGVSADVVQAMSAAGFKLGLTTQRGANHLQRADRLQLKRLNVGMQTTREILRMRLAMPAAWAR